MELLTMKEVCNELRISRKTCERMMKNKELFVVKMGKKNLFKREDIDNLIEKKSTKKDSE